MGKSYRWILLVSGLLINSGEGFVFSSGVDISLNSRYLWRGMSFSHGPVCQSAVWFALGGFSVAPWVNFMLGGAGDGWGWSEFDLTLDYQTEVIGFGLNPSFTAFFYPSGDGEPPAGELGFTLTKDIGNQEIFTAHYFDIGSKLSAYFGELGDRLTLPISSGADFVLSASVGWGSEGFNRLNYATPRWVVDVVYAEGRFNWSPRGVVEIQPFLGMSLVPDRDLRDHAGVDMFQPVFGLAITREF